MRPLRPRFNKLPKLSCLIIAFCVLAPACSDNDVTRVNPLSGYDPGYMLYPSNFLRSPDNPAVVTIDYDSEGKISRRTGGLLPTPGATGFFNVFTLDVYDEVTYGQNKITVVRKDNHPELEISSYRKELTMRFHRITQMITTQTTGPFSATVDTLDLFYKDGVLSKTVQKKYRKTSGDTQLYTSIEKIFTFSGGNLTKVDGVELAASGLRQETLELFDHYDQAPNPAKKLIIFDETFYRSLSRNNFRKYSFSGTNSTGSFTSSNEVSWTFHYDEKGVPTFLP